MSLKDAVFTDSQAKVYLWIFGQPERSYHLSELRRLTGLGSASLQREINRLVVAGLANSTLKGNQRQISANRQSPLFKELSDLTRKVMGAAGLVKEALLPIKRKIEVAFLYGSVAKQSDNAESDIDIMIIGSDLTLGEVLEQLLPVEEMLGRKVNPTCYTVGEFKKRLSDTDSFLNKVLSQPIIQLLGNMDDFRSAQ
ncbi:MAG: nucleotidyltransferase domain-containing protein [Alcaligenaceae bacterium]